LLIFTEIIVQKNEESGYILDTHTAVASGVYEKYRKESGDETPVIIASTASPYKFARSVMDAVTELSGEEEDFNLIDRLCELSGVPVPGAVEEIRTAPVLHNCVVEASDMPQTVLSILKIK